MKALHSRELIYHCEKKLTVNVYRNGQSIAPVDASEKLLRRLDCLPV